MGILLLFSLSLVTLNPGFWALASLFVWMSHLWDTLRSSASDGKSELKDCGLYFPFTMPGSVMVVTSP